MEGIREFLEAARTSGLATGRFRGLLHIAIGRRITKPDGAVVSIGQTWRELAGFLKLMRFDRELVREYGADPDTLAPRDRERFWYSAIAQARVDSREAAAEADALVKGFKDIGYIIGPSPGQPPRPPAGALKPKPDKPTKPAGEQKEKEEKPTKRKKKG